MSEEIAAAAGLVEEIRRLRADNAELRASAELMQQQWRRMVAERANLRQQLAFAEAETPALRTQLALAAAENATLRTAHTAVLAWFDVRGPLLPAAWRDELREALNP